ncbi:MAG: hypothetical protein M5R41_18235 [Bacteroidia bacterium]|nr:hypothetical protein [Bacteroidia bacterium]
MIRTRLHQFMMPESGITSIFLVTITLLTASVEVLAQDIIYPGRPRYSEGQLAITAGGGIAKYNGEFSDGKVDANYWASASWTIGPYLRFGLQAEKGLLSYNRRWRRNTQSAFEVQFGHDGNQVDRSTEFQSFSGLFYLDLLPARYFNVYFLGGAGRMWYTPEDYKVGGLYLMPEEAEQQTWIFPAGLGFEASISRRLAFAAEVRTNLSLTGDLDAFPSDEVRDTYAVRTGAPRNPNAAETANDFHFSLTAGLRIYLFPDTDIDGDGLTNDEEARHNTNPYDQDTDGDGLSDWYELTQLKSSPFLIDTDNDGLTDYEEVVKYHTRSDTLDTDRDNLSDANEVQTFFTNPLMSDTDHDGLPDGEEILLGTNPNMVDTDGDGIPDGKEIEYGTSPLLPDTDGDGLSDDYELFTAQTDALKADTDADGLTDFEEVMIERTNPLKADTDGDTLNDFHELRVIFTNPLSQDTDGDGFRDDVDKCPRLPEAFNGFQDSDGCPDKRE